MGKKALSYEIRNVLKCSPVRTGNTPSSQTRQDAERKWKVLHRDCATIRWLWRNRKMTGALFSMNCVFMETVSMDWSWYYERLEIHRFKTCCLVFPLDKLRFSYAQDDIFEQDVSKTFYKLLRTKVIWTSIIRSAVFDNFHFIQPEKSENTDQDLRIYTKPNTIFEINVLFRVFISMKSSSYSTEIIFLLWIMP